MNEALKCTAGLALSVVMASCTANQATTPQEVNSENTAEVTDSCAKVTSLDGQIVHGDQQFDAFTSDMDAGDINGDGFDDAIIGASGKGLIYLAIGTPDGPKISDACGPWISARNPNAASQFGASVEVVDFDKDGFDDVAVAAPLLAPFQANVFGGAVFIYRGSSTGLEEEMFLLGEEGAPPAFASSLTSGDFDGDGSIELVVGVTLGNSTPSGEFHVFEHSAGGSTFLQRKLVRTAPPEAIDRFGSEVEAGDINFDGIDDLVVASYDGVFLYRGGSSLSYAGSLESRPADSFGTFTPYFLGVGDVIGGPANDLVISDTFSGGVRLYSGGLIPPVFVQELDSTDYGGDVHVDDMTGDGLDDIAFPFDTSVDTTIVAVFQGTRSQSQLSQAWTLDQTGLGDNEVEDRFGRSFASGDFNGDCSPDLIVGAPGEAFGPGDLDPQSGRAFYFTNSQAPTRHFGQAKQVSTSSSSGAAFDLDGAGIDFSGPCPTAQ